jgi:betaine-aldehyde dehydrogenase
MLIDGRWTTGSGKPFSDVNPANQDVIAELGSAAASDVDAAVAAARAACESSAWRDMRPDLRARLLGKIADLIEKDADRLARVQMADNGKTLTECRGQIGAAASYFRYYAAVCETAESSVTPPRGPYWTMMVYEPVGVVATITPWNSPATMEAQKIAPALAAGNAVVHKPSSVTPMIGLEYARIALEAGLPPGALNVLSGSGVIGDQLIEHPGVDMISFTGGTETGIHIASKAAKHLKQVELELGGKSPHIVFADADLGQAVKATSDGIFSGTGQSCVAGSRIFVERAVYEQFMADFTNTAKGFKMGPPDQPETVLGPLVSLAHRKHVEEYVELGRGEGAEVLTGGSRPDGELAQGAYYPATTLAGVGNHSRVAREEIFGPVAVVIPFDDEADVIRQANDTVYGLASGLWTGDAKKAWRVARALRAGTVWINTYKQLSITTPFGGFKHSGLGREKGLQGMRIYQEAKGLYWGL